MTEMMSTLTFKVDSEKFESRVVMFNRDGTVVGPGGGGGTNESMDMDHVGLARNVVRIEFQTRPYTWTKFKRIHVTPNPR